MARYATSLHNFVCDLEVDLPSGEELAGLSIGNEVFIKSNSKVFRLTKEKEWEERNLGTHTGRVGYFICPSVIGNYSVTGLGFKPKVIEFIGHKNDGLQTWFFHSQGFADDTGHQNVSTLAGNFSNLFLGDCKFDRCIYVINTARNIQVMATLVSMDNDGFTLNFTYVNPIFAVRWMAF